MRGKGITMAAAFVNHFMPNGETEVVVTIYQFNLWADVHGFLDLNAEPDTVHQSRNRVRERINRTGFSEAWRKSGHKPFHVRVRDYGRDYIVQHTDVAFDFKAQVLPERVESIVNTKKVLIDKLIQSVDFKTLPIEMQMKLGGLKTEVDEYRNDINHVTKRVERRILNVRAELKKALLAIQPPADGAMQEFIESADEEDDEPSTDA